MKEKRTWILDPSTLMIVTIALLGVVIYAGNVFTVNTSKITDIICLASFTFMPISGIVCAICFLIPLHSGITGLYIYGYAVAMILFKSKNLKAKVVIPVLFVIMYEMIMMLFAGASQFNQIIVYALAVFLLLYIMNSDEINYKASCISYICGAVVLLLCIFTTAVQNNSLAMVLSGAVRIGEYEGAENLGQVAVVTENANAMAYYALVGIAMAFSMLKNAQRREKIFLITSMVLLTIISLFTVSRTFVLVLVGLVLLVVFSDFDFKKNGNILIIIGLVLAVVIPILQYKTQIFDAFIERFEDDSMATGTGRTEIFLEYMDFLFKNPVRFIFGTGSVFYKQVCNLLHSMHNGTQQILVSYGILGFIPVISVLAAPVVDFVKKNGFKLTKLLPVLAVIIFTQTIQFLNPNNLMLPYAIAVLCMKIPDMEVSE